MTNAGENTASDDGYPWRKRRGLLELFAEVQPVFVSLGVVVPGGGCAQAEIDAVERRMDRALPEDVRAFYRTMSPTEIFSKEELDPSRWMQPVLSPKDFGFYQLTSKDFRWQSMEEAEPEIDWQGETGLSLGQSVFGDPFWWVEGHKRLSNGSIVVLNHDGGFGLDYPFICFARTFRELLVKMAYFKGLCTGVEDELALREHRELNPPRTY